eukprot:TRINITY_DN1821_c0_g1::TRINITY_DN1821_c0_g1_i1::g.14082::m.14082 TRINITY_DN1821_c0_g1::TRINITY_DN1821_c0_g1_i1::g.14082  ORF type:complete len:115 (-),score=37.81 TRINITY_DN1821_c0_g1_i1:677-1021(-)
MSSSDEDVDSANNSGDESDASMSDDNTPAPPQLSGNDLAQRINYKLLDMILSSHSHYQTPKCLDPPRSTLSRDLLRLLHDPQSSALVELADVKLHVPHDSFKVTEPDVKRARVN